MTRYLQPLVAAAAVVAVRAGHGAKARGHPEGLPLRQSGEHIDPRRDDILDCGIHDGVFNNLVIHNQDEPKNSLHSIILDLATRWWWSEDGSHLTFARRDSVKAASRAPDVLTECRAPMTTARVRKMVAVGDTQVVQHHLGHKTPSTRFASSRPIGSNHFGRIDEKREGCSDLGSAGCGRADHVSRF